MKGEGIILTQSFDLCQSWTTVHEIVFRMHLQPPNRLRSCQEFRHMNVAEPDTSRIGQAGVGMGVGRAVHAETLISRRSDLDRLT